MIISKYETKNQSKTIGFIANSGLILHKMAVRELG